MILGLAAIFCFLVVTRGVVVSHRYVLAKDAAGENVYLDADGFSSPEIMCEALNTGDSCNGTEIVQENMNRWLEDPLYSDVGEFVRETPPDAPVREQVLDNSESFEAAQRVVHERMQKDLVEGIRRVAKTWDEPPDVLLVGGVDVTETVRELSGCGKGDVAAAALVVAQSRRLPLESALRSARACAKVPVEGVIADFSAASSREWLSSRSAVAKATKRVSDSEGVGFGIVAMAADELEHSAVASGVLGALAGVSSGCVLVGMRDEARAFPRVHVRVPAWTAFGVSGDPAVRSPGWVASRLQSMLGDWAGSMVVRMGTDVDDLERVVVGCRDVDWLPDLPRCVGGGGGRVPCVSLSVGAGAGKAVGVDGLGEAGVSAENGSVVEQGGGGFDGRRIKGYEASCASNRGTTGSGSWIVGTLDDDLVVDAADAKKTTNAKNGPRMVWRDGPGIARTRHWTQALAVAEAALERLAMRGRCGDRWKNPFAEKEDGGWREVCDVEEKEEVLSSAEEDAIRVVEMMRHRSVALVGDSVDRTSVSTICGAARNAGAWRSALVVVDSRAAGADTPRTLMRTEAWHTPHSAETVLCYLPALDTAVVAAFHFGVSEELDRQLTLLTIRGHLDELRSDREQLLLAETRVAHALGSLFHPSLRNPGRSRRCRGTEGQSCRAWGDGGAVGWPLPLIDSTIAVLLPDPTSNIPTFLPLPLPPPSLALLSLSAGTWDAHMAWEAATYMYRAEAMRRTLWPGNAARVFPTLVETTAARLRRMRVGVTRMAGMALRSVDHPVALATRMPVFPYQKLSRTRSTRSMQLLSEHFDWKSAYELHKDESLILQYGATEVKITTTVHDELQAGVRYAAAAYLPRIGSAPLGLGLAKTPSTSLCKSPAELEFTEVTAYLAAAANPKADLPAINTLRDQLHTAGGVQLVLPGDGIHPAPAITEALTDLLLDTATEATGTPRQNIEEFDTWTQDVDEPQATGFLWDHRDDFWEP